MLVSVFKLNLLSLKPAVRSLSTRGPWPTLLEKQLQIKLPSSV